MSDLGPHRHYATNHYGSQANFSSIIDEKNTAQVEAAKQYAQQNPVGKLVGDLNEKENPLNPLFALLYGIPAVFIPGWINKKVAEGASIKDSRVHKTITWLDRLAENRFVKPVDNFFKGMGQRLNNWSIVEHFRQNAERTQPVNGLVRESCRPLQGEFITNIVSDTKKLYESNGKKHFEELFKSSIKENIERSDGFWKKRLNWLGFLPGGRSENYRKSAQQAIKAVEKRIGKKIFNRDGSINPEHLKKFELLSEKHKRAYEKSLRRYSEAIKSGDQTRIARASRGLFKRAIKTMGEYESNHIRLLGERFKRMPINSASRQQVYKETVNHLAKLAGFSNRKARALVSGLENKSVEETDRVLSQIFKKLKEKGFNIDSISTTSNRFQTLMNSKPGSFLSSGLKGLYTAGSKTFKMSDIVAMYFIGDVIRKTVQAKEGERLSTFMEGMFGEVIPYWTMMSVLTKLPYNAAEGLKTLGKESSSWITRTAAKPLNWAGSLLGLGVREGFHFRLGLDPITGQVDNKALSEIFKKPGARIERFKELQAKILAGEGGPKGFISRLASGDFKFWKGASETWREMKGILNKDIPFLKRWKLKLKSFCGGGAKLAAVILVLMPFASGILTKLSHSLFGKPSTTKESEEAEKAEKEAEKNPLQPEEALPLDSAGTNSAFVNKFVQKAGEIDSSSYTVTSSPSMIDQYLNKAGNNPQPVSVSTAATNPSMVNDYLETIRKNPYNRNNQAIASTRIRNDNIPARSLNAPPRDYSSIPAPINTNPETIARFNKAVADTDKVLNSTEKFLENL